MALILSLLLTGYSCTGQETEQENYTWLRRYHAVTKSQPNRLYHKTTGIGLELDTTIGMFSIYRSGSMSGFGCSQMNEDALLQGNYTFVHDTLVLSDTASPLVLRFLTKGDKIKPVTTCFGFPDTFITGRRYRQRRGIMFIDSLYRKYRFADVDKRGRYVRFNKYYQTMPLRNGREFDGFAIEFVGNNYKVTTSGILLSQGYVSYDKRSRQYIMHDESLNYDFHMIAKYRRIVLLDYPSSPRTQYRTLPYRKIERRTQRTERYYKKLAEERAAKEHLKPS